MSKYLEEPKNPGKDDGECALCGRPGLDEEFRCYGCGYLVCEECDEANPWGTHLVVAHKSSEEEW